ncbi:hypothetical protein ACEPAI_8458 [Sanghuangporus weigelae]
MSSPTPSPPPHFLSLPRPDALAGPPQGVPDTTTVAAHDFDIDARTGFMPPQPPLSRLPEQWEAWERILDEAIERRLKLGAAQDLTPADEATSDDWRQRVRELPILPTTDLKTSEVTLRRAHLALAWIMHFYINTLSPTSPLVIPRPISIPLLEVSNYLALPPILTYSDDVLYNWKYREDVVPDGQVPLPTANNIAIQTSFTSSPSEDHFYLVPAYMELRGATALSLMSRIMDEAFVHDAIALRRISYYLMHLARVIDDLRNILMTMRDGCDPEVFYHEVRPWFKGQDSMHGGRKWVFEGVGEDGYEHLKHPTDDELHGPSAGQSALIHAIDIFLGVDSSASSSTSSTGKTGMNFLAQMQNYMPRHHRAFLRHLSSNPRLLRALVDSETTENRNPELLNAYNTAVTALRTLRDYHLRIVAMYIVGPSRRAEIGNRLATIEHLIVEETESSGEKGTGGTNAMIFLKGVRDKTASTVLTKN